MTDPTHDVTGVLLAWGERQSGAEERLFPLVYDELKRIARRHLSRERSDNTLQPTALVHEAYLRLIDQTRVVWRNRSQFYAVAAQMMRRILVNHARLLAAGKRGGGTRRVSIAEVDLACDGRPVDLLALDEALQRLQRIDARKGRVVELLYFGGLENEEVAEVLGVSEKTVRRDWQMARSWLYRELSSKPGATGT